MKARDAIKKSVCVSFVLKKRAKCEAFILRPGSSFWYHSISPSLATSGSRQSSELLRYKQNRRNKKLQLLRARARSPPARTSPPRRHGGRRREQPSCSCGKRCCWAVVELGREPGRLRGGGRRVHRTRRWRALVARRRRPGHDAAAAGGYRGASADTEGGEVAVEEGRKEAGRRRRHQRRHRRRRRRGRREAAAVAALRPRGGRRRDERRAPARPHAGGRHARREVAAARAAAGAVARSQEGRLSVRHIVQRGDVDPALLHALHEQDGRRHRRRRRRRRPLKRRPAVKGGSFRVGVKGCDATENFRKFRHDIKCDALKITQDPIERMAGKRLGWLGV